MQPLLATGDYSGFKELARPRTFDFLEYGATAGSIAYDPATRSYTADPDGPTGAAPPFTFGDPDFNLKSLRLNAVFRWEMKTRLELLRGVDAPAAGLHQSRPLRARPRRARDVRRAGRRHHPLQDSRTGSDDNARSDALRVARLLVVRDLRLFQSPWFAVHSPLWTPCISPAAPPSEAHCRQHDPRRDPPGAGARTHGRLADARRAGLRHAGAHRRGRGRAR